MDDLDIAAPHVWGEGALFGFSGIDGGTDSASLFVATFGAEPLSFLFHTPTRRIFSIDTPQLSITCALSDIVIARTGNADVTLAFTAWHTLIGTMPAGTTISLVLENGDNASVDGEFVISADSAHNDVLMLAIAGGRCALSYGVSVDEAKNRAVQGLADDMGKTIAARASYYMKLPPLLKRDALFVKCASVMKVNALSPEGMFPHRWSTPDRVPHKDMWLWDSVFHSFAMNHIDGALAWDYLRSVLAMQANDGFIPHQMRPDGWRSKITQPPILAWGVWENYQRTKDKSALSFALPKLEAYINWDIAHRNKNKSGLLVWDIEGDPKCRSGESGLDNSPRFDEAVDLDAVDFSVFAVNDMRMIARIAKELGDHARADTWNKKADAMETLVHSLLWDEKSGFYYDRHANGSLSPVKAVTGFLPLMLTNVPKERIDRLIIHLYDPNEFASAFPVPSVSLSEPTWGTDMWRGATWINTNYLIALGLALHGRTDEASSLRKTTVAFVRNYYERYGVTFEFYDAKDGVPPMRCDRKGPTTSVYDIRKKMDSIRDYHWTAALT
ncbi:MAG: trehalase family glycosidase, partial [Spirochaetota bacterium]